MAVKRTDLRSLSLGELCERAKELYSLEFRGAKIKNSELDAVIGELRLRGFDALEQIAAEALQDALGKSFAAKDRKEKRLSSLSESEIFDLLGGSVQSADWRDLAKSLGLGGNLVIIRVEGDSMTGAGIDPGDLFIAERSVTADSGDIAIVSIEGVHFIKRINRDNGSTVLISENKKYPPFILEEKINAEIIGIVRKIIKNPS